MIDLQKLSEIQRVLRDRIEYDGPDRQEKLCLAFLVELGELANETRFFKFWSIDQEMRKEKALVEYVDNIHFILDIGLGMHISNYNYWFDESNIKDHAYDNLTGQFLWVSNTVTKLWMRDQSEDFETLVYEYIALGYMLGFSWEEIEQSYMEKNKINHLRQQNGY